VLMADVFLVVGGLFLLGIIGFFVAAAALVVRFVGFVARTLFGWPEEPHALAAGPGRRRMCPHPRCGQMNPPTARYCGRCGRGIRPLYDVDAYG
jgi:hypothetical protein